MVDKDFLKRLFIAFYPPVQTVNVSMAAHTGKHKYLSPDNDFLAEKLCSFCTLHKTSSKGIHSLIAHKKYGVFRFPQIVLEVVFYSARLAHTACGNYYLRCVDKVYGS